MDYYKRIAEALEKISESGGGGGPGGGLVVHSVLNETTQKYVLDKTLQEIYNALVAGNSVCIISEDDAGQTIWCDLTVGVVDENYYVLCNQGADNFTCTSPDEYPHT